MAMYEPTQHGSCGGVRGWMEWWGVCQTSMGSTQHGQPPGLCLPQPTTASTPAVKVIARPGTPPGQSCLVLSSGPQPCLVLCPRYGTVVAAKILKGSSDIALGDFRGEIEILRRVHHPNAVQVRA